MGNDGNLKGLIRDDEVFERMPLAYRIQHFALMIDILVLLLTGLPLLFPDSKILSVVFIVPEVFVLRGAIHRIAALVLVGLVIIHVIYLIFSDKGHEDAKEMLPRAKDFRSGAFRYALGLSKDRPRAGRFTLPQKLHYWALCTGIILMIVTGFMIWRQEEMMMLVPKWVVDLAAFMHGDEALLVFLLLMVWHLYAVHLAPGNFPMNRAWLDGKITGKKMKLNHPMEHEKIEKDRMNEQKVAKTHGHNSSD